jgi:hypothetical protein
MHKNITIQSENLFLSSSVNGVNISANTDFNIYSGKSMVFTTGQLGSVNLQNNFTVQSQNIVLGYPKDSTVKLESSVKSDQLINILSQMLSIMNDIVTNPTEVECIRGEITELSKQLNKIKSETTKLY